MNQFIKKHEEKIVGVLSGWDRIRFLGTLRVLSDVRGMMSWLGEQHVLLKQFRGFAIDLTKRLQASVEATATAAGRTIQYLASSTLSKEALVQELLRREGLREGLVCVLSCVEPCYTFDVRRNKAEKWIDLVRSVRKCLHWYLYYLHPLWGLCHVRIQSWLPFTVHVCVNGRESLCQELKQAGIGHRQQDNCLVSVDDAAAAQRILDAQPWANWSGQLTELLARACPELCSLQMQGAPLVHYWSAQETEWATDIMFRSPAALANLYPALVRHGISMFSSADVMRFLGRQQLPQDGGVYAHFPGDVVSDLKRRSEGIRVKHRLNANSIKMYDKQGSVLRIETTINDARDMRVYRTSENDPSGPKKLQRLRKGVVDLPRRAEISQAANKRYLEALAAVETPTLLRDVLDRLAQPIKHDGRRSRGLQPLSGRDADLVAFLMRGEFTINGFRNRDLRHALFGPTDDPAQIPRQSASSGRLLRLFREHKLIYRVKGTHRYQLSAEGRRQLPVLLAVRQASTRQLQQTTD
jgi:hypothetical protein